MKKIIIINDNFIFGGTNTAVLPIIDLLLKKEYDITLWIVSGVYDKELIKRLPNKVNIVYGYEISSKEKMIRYLDRIKKYIKNPLYIYKKFVDRNRNNPFSVKENENIENKISSDYGFLEEKYDIAFYFDVEIMDVYINFINKHIKALKNYLWIHTDYSSNLIKERFNISKEISVSTLEKFTEILAVSENAKQGFIREIGNMSKVNVIKLPLNIDWILKKSQKDVSGMKRDRLNVVTVARLAEVKGIDRAIKVHRKLKDEGFSFNWYVIGDGELKDTLVSQIKNLELEKDFFLLGKKNNPYPFIRNADIFAFMSRTESFGIVVDEANLLGVPVLATNVGGIQTIISNREDGIIVGNNEIDIYNGLKELIISNELRDKMANHQTLEERIKIREEDSSLIRLLD